MQFAEWEELALPLAMAALRLYLQSALPSTPPGDLQTQQQEPHLRGQSAVAHLLSILQNFKQRRLPTTWECVLASRLALTLVEFRDPGEGPETAPCLVAVGVALRL